MFFMKPKVEAETTTPKPFEVPRMYPLRNVPRGLSRFGFFHCDVCKQVVTEPNFKLSLSRRAKMGHILGFCSGACKDADQEEYQKMIQLNKLALSKRGL